MYIFMNTSAGVTTFTMALLYLIIALVVQGSFINANIDNSEEVTASEPFKNDKPEIDDEVVKDFQNARRDWIDFFLLPDAQIYPSSSVAMMTQATNSNKTAEEQLEEIKEIAQTITLAIQSEMANLLSYALTTYDNDKVKDEDNNLRKKRSTETPMASTQLITRLLKHIKSNNEYQNIAIDKMMTAQEIADKYGVEFSPDTEIISDLAFAANQHAKEMTSLLQDTLEMKNSTRRLVEPVNEESECSFAFAQPHQEQTTRMPTQPEVNHHHYPESYPSYNYYYNYPYETQIPAPSSNYYSPPVSKRPNFYDAVSYSPDYYPPYCSEPVTTTTTVVLPYDMPYEPEPEPELVGEEFEETITSKVYVDRGDEPGSATVNHVMTYTIGEKSHFRTPEIERLPQQMQYCFFLM